MTDVNLQLVREFFELNVFRVLTNWQQEPWRNSASEASPQLFVENARPVIGRELPFVLGRPDIPGIERAVVHVRAWHTDRFYPSVIESSPVLSRFEAEEATVLAGHVFAEQPYLTILVISGLPVAAQLRARSIELLQEAGVDHVIEFPTVLRDLLEHVNVDSTYGASPTLQTLRLLKRYKFIRDQQLELSLPTEPPVPATPPVVEIARPDSEEETD